MTRPSVPELAERLIARDRTALARAITLVESSHERDIEQAEELIATVLPRTGRSMRIGITGIPGAGKSTFIEALGMDLISSGKSVAVLTVDPSSPISGGSLLGDKTRMPRLCQERQAYVRPSPAKGHLGGVGQNTRQALLLCEAAGFDVVVVETVGTGQSEFAVRDMTDFFLLLAIAGAGDELQGIKRGMLELVDAICINKADSGNELRAEAARQQYVTALHMLRPDDSVPVIATSAVNGTGVSDTWAAIEERLRSLPVQDLREEQAVRWLHESIDRQLKRRFESHPGVLNRKAQIERDVRAGKLDATAAAKELLSLFII